MSRKQGRDKHSRGGQPVVSRHWTNNIGARLDEFDSGLNKRQIKAQEHKIHSFIEDPTPKVEEDINEELEQIAADQAAEKALFKEIQDQDDHSK